ncbi:hypothetical protein HYX13_03995 [Candidatus Woesearchaeota archaeon]|nr:hypothetical protein [Candidatus Woesearchaeota archaeon]
MLTEERVKEAEQNWRSYLSDHLVKKDSFKQIVFDTFLRNHLESLNVAEHLSMQNLSSLWTIVVSYYSMFYLANAVIYKNGYKIGEKVAHKITADALVILVRNKLKSSLLQGYEQAQNEALEIAKNRADELINSFDKEREKRSYFQYETTEEIKSGKAKTSFERAKLFSTELHKLLIR